MSKKKPQFNQGNELAKKMADANRKANEKPEAKKLMKKLSEMMYDKIIEEEDYKL